MAETQVQAPGTFCWCDLSTTDISKARPFYGDLFGWDHQEVPAGPEHTYTMLRFNGNDVGGMSQLTDEMQSQGVPSNWMSYVQVDDVDASTKKAGELGGTIVMPPFDVMEVGRMSVVQDPTGGTFAMWQPKDNKGATVMGPPGTACWFECMSQNKAEAGAFYAGLFGWQLEDFQGPMDYTLFKQGETSVGGLMQITEEMQANGPVPSHWMVYFAVEDCDASAKKAAELGGMILVPPTDIPSVGKFSVVMDPTQGVFSIIQLEMPSS